MKSWTSHLGSTKSKRGLSFVEILISVFIYSLAFAIIATGIVTYARQQRATSSQQYVDNLCRRLMTEMVAEASEATSMFASSQAGNSSSTLTIVKPNGVTVFSYNNGDGNENTLNDNRILRQDGTTINTLGAAQEQLRWASTMGRPVFQLDSRTSTSTLPLINVLVRVGDRNFPPNAADQALTGPGYQSFLIDLNLSRGQRIGE